MKRIMKKALSLALALVMLLCLTPMTTKAEISFGTGEILSPYMMDLMEDTTPALEFGQPAVFACQVQQAGTYDVTVRGAGMVVVGVVDIVNEVIDEQACMQGNGTATMSIESIANRQGQNFVYFYVVNCNTSGNGVYDVLIEAVASEQGEVTGTGTEVDPYDITEVLETPNAPGIGHQQSAYYMLSDLTPGSKYEINLSCAAVMGGLNAYAVSCGDAYVESEYWGTIDATIMLDASDEGTIVFKIESLMAESGPFTVAIRELPLGSDSNPDKVVFGENKTTVLTDEQYLYYYEWTATEDGYFEVKFDDAENEDGWVYSITDKNYVFEGIYCESLYDEDPEDWGTEYINPGKVGVFAGETVVLMFATPMYSAGTVCYDVKFTPDEVVRAVDPLTLFEDITQYNELTGLDDLLYRYYKVAVEESVEEIPLGNICGGEVVPTLYAFTPVSAGVYEISILDGKIGFYGNNLSNISAPSEMSSTVKVTIQSAGQSAYVGVSEVEGEYTSIEVKLIESIVENQNQTEYVDVKIEGPSPEVYTFTGNVDNLEYIDVEDDVVDKVVFSVSDGYYHYGSVSGPVVYVDIAGAYGSFNPLVSAKNDALKAVDEDGNRWNYSSLYVCYSKVADKETGLYPLNDDLIEIFKVAGKNQGWYMAALGGIETEDAWMFNCCYIPADDVASGGNAGSSESEKEPVKVEVPADKVITESALGTAIQEAVTNNAPLVVETTTEGVTLTFAPADLKDAEAVKLNVEVKLDVDVKDETVAKNDDITADNFVLKVEFSHDGKLPAKATITIPVPAKFANKTLFYYEILADGTLKFVCDAPVDADGNAKVTQDHCSDYVLLTEKVAEAPKTGDNTNFALWITILGLGVVAIAGSVVMKKENSNF